MNFISKLIARPKSLIGSSDEMEQQTQLVSTTPVTVASATAAAAASPLQETTIEELLVQINDNLTNQTIVALSGNNQKQLTAQNNKQQHHDAKQQVDAVNLVGISRSNESLSENFYNNTEKKKTIAFAGSNNTSLDSASLDLPGGILLPSIIGQSETSLEDSLVSSLASKLDSALVLNTTVADEFNRSKSLSVPLESESSGSHVYSDNETYVECRSFSPSEGSNRFTSALDLVSIADSSHGWDDLVSSVTEMNMDSLENTNVQLDVQLDMTPTESTNTGLLNLTTEAIKIEQLVEVVKEPEIVASNSVQEIMENDENMNVATCMLPEAVANLIENVDTNSCDDAKENLEKCQELQIVPTTIEDLSRSQREFSLDLSSAVVGVDKEFSSNVTLEADKAFPTTNQSVSLSDIIKDSSPNKSIVLSWATVEQTVEKLTTSNSSENEANLTQDLLAPCSNQNLDVTMNEDTCAKNDVNATQEVIDSATSEQLIVGSVGKLSISQCSDSGSNLTQEIVRSPSSELLAAPNESKLSTSNSSEDELNRTQEFVRVPSPQQIEDFDADQPLPETPNSQHSSNLQFPVKPSQDKSSFPQSPTQNNPPSDFPNACQRATSETKIDEVCALNETIDIIKTSPNGTNSCPVEVEKTLSNHIKSPDNLNCTTTILNDPNDSGDSETQMDSTFNTKHDILNVTKTTASDDFNQTFNGDSDVMKSNLLHNQTINMDENQGGGVNETRTFEPMEVDVTSPNNNKHLSNPMTQVFPSTTSTESLSEKEKCDTKDEKDVFVEKCESNYQQDIDDMFKAPKEHMMTFSGQNVAQPSDIAADEDFQSNRLFLNPSDFDFLLTKGNGNSSEVDRSSLLLRFDPLLGHSVPVNQSLKAGSSTLSALVATASLSNDKQQQDFYLQNRLSPANEEEEHLYDSNRSFQLENGLNCTQRKPKPEELSIEDRRQQKQKPIQVTARSIKNCAQVSQERKNVKMSVDVMQDMKIENDSKSIEEIDQQTEKKQNFKMDELEKKIKNEVLKTEDIEKKLKEAEQREEALIKRITEKDKTIAKMNGVIEAYEKAIAELISEKEQILQNYEKQLTEVKADRDSNYHHLTSLETTFSDLHVKYEKSKEMTAQLKSSEESLLAEKRQNLENLRLQEQRYEKMKNHAMQQLEIANKKLESLTKNHSMEITKLKALLKKEEISRASMTEQLQQKTRENEELVKICDELINGQGS